MAAPDPKRRWFLPTPGHLLVVLLVAEGILLLSERLIPKGYAVLIAVAAVGVFLILMVLWFVLALVFHWQYQFSLRSLLLLTVAVAIPFSWLAVEIKRARAQKKIVDTWTKMGGTVCYDYETVFGSTGVFLVTRDLPSSKWLRRLTGDDFFIDVVECTSSEALNDGDLKNLSELQGIRQIQLYESRITDDGLKQLSGMKHLQYLILIDVPITDGGLKHLEGWRQLRRLILVQTQITDDGIKSLQRAIPNLQILYTPQVKRKSGYQ